MHRCGIDVALAEPRTGVPRLTPHPFGLEASAREEPVGDSPQSLACSSLERVEAGGAGVADGRGRTKREGKGVRLMTPGRHLQRSWMAGCALAASVALLGACAAGRSESRDESAERLEEALRPAQPSEPIPEGIAFVPDTPLSGSAVTGEALTSEDAAPEPASEEVPGTEPPLAPDSWGALVAPCKRPPHGAILPAPVPLSCLLNPGAIEYRIAPRPGGSIPGLLP